MATINEYLQKHDVWDKVSFSDRSNVAVSELWQRRSEDTKTFTREDFSVAESSLQSWLSDLNHSKEIHHGTKRKRSIRAVWIPKVAQKQILDVSETIFNEVHANFQHRTAYSNCRASPAGLGRLASDYPSTQTYFLSLQPKVSMTWSIDEEAGVTSIICVADETKIKTLKDLLGQRFIQKLDNHAMAPAIMYATLLSMEVDLSYQQVKRQLRQVEIRTGHHDWTSRSEPSALGDLAGLSAKVSGYQMRIGSEIRKQHTVAEVLRVIRDYQGRTHDTSSSCDPILDMVETLEEKANAQQIYADYIQCRIRTQLDALYHLVAQRDALLNQEMAQDCKHLAVAAQRDSSSMKCIAAVTMFFLPGTFMSSLFSIPLFDWDATNYEDIYRTEYWRPRLVMFLATTLPLMCLTFGAWALWNMAERIRQRKRFAVMKAQLSISKGENEAKTLSLKRSSLTDVF